MGAAPLCTVRPPAWSSGAEDPGNRAVEASLGLLRGADIRGDFSWVCLPGAHQAAGGAAELKESGGSEEEGG